MKKICFLSLLSLLFVTMPSCSDELDGGKENPGAAGGRTLFTATVEALQSEADTETQNDFWAPGDKIKLVLNDNSSLSANLIAGQGTESGSFMGTLPEGKTAKYAVYPESAFDSADGEGLNLVVPSAQYGYLTDCKAAAGKVAVGNKVALKNLTAVLPVNILAGADVCKVELSSVDGSALAGVVSVSFTEEGLALGTIQNPSSTVSLDVYGAGTYYFAVIPEVAHAQGLKVSWYLSEDPATAAGEKELEATTYAVNTLYEAVEIKTVDKNFYVTVEGAGTKDGKSWENAMSGAAFYEMLTSAVYVAPEEPVEPEPTDPAEPALADESADSTEPATPSVDAFNGATFHFAAGTYNFGPAPELTYEETVTLEFLGGYDANGNRNVADNTTVFTGNKEHRIFNFASEMQCKFDGIDFVDGYVEGRGGALNILGGTFQFINCNFSNNEVTERGGAVRIEDNADVSFVDCNFVDNKTLCLEENKANSSGEGAGGAIYSGGQSVNITIQGGRFSNNVAWRGGAIASYNAKVTVTDATFANNGHDYNYNGGAIYSVSNLTLNNCTFTGHKGRFGATIYATGKTDVNGCTFEDNHAFGNAGAIATAGKGNMTISAENPTIFKNNTAELYGGALELENNSNDIKGAEFIANSAKFGGAVAVYGTKDSQTKVTITDSTFGGIEEGESNHASNDGGVIYHEDNCLVNLARVSIVCNYAGNNGGAIAVHGWNACNIYQTEFVDNYAKSGGAIYTEKSGEDYANLYIDECSFDANHISGGYGTTMNVNGINGFCLNNSSVRGSYNTSNQTADKASWIAMDAVQDFTSISNCTVIGNTQYGDGTSFTTVSGAGLVALWGNNHYFTNNIIVPEAEGVHSILGGGSDAIDLAYTHYNTASKVTATDNGGNTTGLTSAAFGSLTWTDGCWMWNGQINGAAPSLMTKEAVLARLNAICLDFVTWCGDDFYKDQRFEDRGESWWPGAYQNN